jgi:hypothetical protein
MQIYPVLNNSELFKIHLMFLILVVFAQSGFWSAVPVSCMSASRTIRCFTFFQILGKLPVVPVGDTGTIPYSMRQHAEDFVGAAFDTRVEAGDGSR